MMYLLPANPARATLTLGCLRQRARRAGYIIARDRAKLGARWRPIEVENRAITRTQDYTTGRAVQPFGS